MDQHIIPMIKALLLNDVNVHIPAWFFEGMLGLQFCIWFCNLWQWWETRKLEKGCRRFLQAKEEQKNAN